MRTKVIVAVVIFTLILSICSARIISQSAITSILQDIMSPANTKKAMQLINTAAARANRKIAIPGTAFAGNDCGLSARTGDLPTIALARSDHIKIANDILPTVIASKDIARLIAAKDQRVLSPEFIYPFQQKAVRQAARDFVVLPPNKNDLTQIYETTPIGLPREVGCPCRTSAPSLYFQTGLTNPFMPVNTPAPNSYLPVVAPNPYQEVAAPNPGTSTLPAMPSLLPPPTQSKGKFLRKIPIPPPMM